MDHRAQRRIWGRARVVEEAPALLARLADAPAARTKAVEFTIDAWEVETLVAGLRARVTALEAEIAELKAANGQRSE